MHRYKLQNERYNRCCQVRLKVDNQQPGVPRCAYHAFLTGSSSPWPPIGTFIFTQAPAIAMTVQLYLEGYLILFIYLILLQIFIFFGMIKVLTTNPGILPQITYKCQTEQQLFEVPTKPAMDQHKYLIPQRNLLHHQKYCAQCHIYRPIRSIHCSACNHCVERYDHHCPWLSVCIGKYNYKYFLSYLIGLVLLIISALSIGIAFTVVISRKEQSLVKDFVVYMLVGLIAFIFLIPITRLLIYHFQLINKGITTNQQIKKTFKIIDNQLPFQKLEYAIHRQKRLPKYSYRIHKLKKMESIRIDRNQQSRSLASSRGIEMSKIDRVGIFNSLIQNQHL